jgi:poly(3-hydroxybutyrate) depolymerase
VRKEHHHLEVKGAGHYGIFSGRRWREVVYPHVKSFILEHNKAGAKKVAAKKATAKKTVTKVAKSIAKTVAKSAAKTSAKRTVRASSRAKK